MIPILYFVVPGFLVLQFFESPSSVVGSTPSLSNIEVMNVRSEDDSTAEAHEREVQAWHDRRIANLKRDHGWLTLIALDWMQEGPNEIPSIGIVTLKGGSITVKLAPGVQADIGGKPFTSGSIRTDADEGGPDKIVVGSRAFVVIKRADRHAVRMWDSNHEARKRFRGIERYPVSGTWRIEARWRPYDPPKRINVPSVIPDYVEDYPVPGVAVFSMQGKEYRLEPVLEPGETDLFFIFADKTNGKETYGGGRFLYAKPASNGVVVLDFNKSYNPPCAFTEFATCPLPPASNRLNIRIDAGEKKYSEH